MQYPLLIDETERDKELQEILCELRKLRERLRKILKRPIHIDYEKWVKERSKKLLGEVKELYTYTEASKILGIAVSTIAYRVWRGQIKTFGGKIPFSEIVLLAEYYRDLKELRDELHPKGSKCSNRQNR